MTIKDPSKVDPPSKYRIVVTFKFGAAEFQAVARDDQTGEEVKTSVVLIAD